ncbi:tyrosine-type recombinase/integrase [Kitasatospora sp. NPDC008050]|uniref:tyrosine-type recombinase/integrase n=1 Tax=Kitasatospora sp. NPDC008050 TaxID=3364021 RepID=UPI0036E92136
MDGGGQRRGPAPKAMTGPLARCEGLLRTELARTGYAQSSVRDAVRTMRRLSCWMEERGLTAPELTPDAVEKFLTMRRRVTGSEAVARRSLGAVLRVLRADGAVPPRAGSGGTPVEVLLGDYRAYLAGERGLAAESVRCHALQARKLLEWLPEPLDEELAALDAARVTAFMVEQCTRAASVWSAKALVTAARSLLRYLHVTGRIPLPLTAAVPAVAGWRLGSLPRGLTSAQVGALLAAPDTGTAAGLRDRAVLVLLARLGLRGAEVAALDLADVDWRAGELTVRGKGSRVEALPLPVEVGQAMATYLTQARPRCTATTVFVTSRAPYQPLTGTCIRAIMGRACTRAGLPRFGAHRLRHSVATEILRSGAGLVEVGQVLRHRSQLSTTVYAKVDHAALRTLARPWPHGGAR